MNYSWKDWQSAQRMLDLYDKHRILYYAYILWLMLQSAVAFVILLFIIAFLTVMLIVSQRYILSIICLTCFASWIYKIYSAYMNNPCKGMFLVDKQKYRNIYDRVNEISRNFKGPKIHEIYIVMKFNAAATNRYIFTPFKRNILILGYPLICALSYRGLVGSLAHEIGHIKHRHISASSWIMMTNAFWSNVELGIFRLIFVSWLRYWLPAFNKATAPLYRQHEIEADKFIVKTFGKDYLSACQVELLLKGEQNSDVADELMNQMRSDSWEQCNILKVIRDGLYEGMPEDRNEQVIAHQMKSVPDVFDSHPSFAQRLELADCRCPMSFAQFEANALEELIGHNEEFDAELNAHFHAELDDYANKVRTEAEQCRRLLELNPPSVDSMNEDELVGALYYLEKTGQKKERLELLQQCVEAFPNFLQFRAMLALEHVKDDPDGAAAELEYCISQAPALHQLDENNFLLQYYIDSGDIEKIHAYLDMKDGRICQLISLTQKELDENDDLEPMVLPQEIINFLTTEFMTQFEIVNRAYCVSRAVDDRTAFRQSFIVLEADPHFLQTIFSKKSIIDAIIYFSQALKNTNYFIVRCKTVFCDKHLESLPGAKFYSKYGKLNENILDRNIKKYQKTS